MSIKSFLRLNPPNFSENPLTDDPQQFLHRINKVLRCSSERAVELVANNLNGLVEQLYETLLRGRDASGLPPLTWEEFTEVFIIRFLSINKKEKSAADFERLRQAS